MQDNKTSTGLNRRNFLASTGAVSGSLMLGFAVGMPLISQAASSASASHAPNAWVRITDDNVITLITARSEMGQGVYTAMPMLIAEELQVDIKKILVEVAPANKVYTNALLGAQITGGSTSTQDAWVPLRTAGAQVRMMLISAAATQWKVDASTLRAQDGMVLGPNGKKASYGSLAAAASKLPVPTKVVLKDPKDFTLIGKPTKRLDTPSKVNGTAEFGIDVKLPGMVYASLQQCAVIGGKVKSFDAAKAKTMPGVIDVVQIPDGIAVVAESYWQAYKARQAVTIVWDEGALASTTHETMLEGIRKASTTGKALSIIAPKGDVPAAMKGATKIIKAEYVSQLLAHATMEPQNFTADFKNGKCMLIGPTQFQTGAVGGVAAALGIKPEDVTVETTFLGGGFGRRLEVDFIVQAAQISKAVGRPVKMVWSREDDTTHDFYRPMAVNQLLAAIGPDGKPVAFDFRMTSQSITQRAFGLPKDTVDAFMTEAAVVGYDIPNTRYDLVIHDTGLRAGYWRSVSHAINAFANESFVDEMAAAAGQDPYAFRMSMLAKQPRYAHVLKLAAEKAGWGTAAPAGRTRGMALMSGYNSYMAQIVEISVKNNFVTVHKVTVVADVGMMINPDTVLAQIQSSIIFGMTAALNNEVTLVAGKVQQTNFGDYPVPRMNESPEMDITLVASTETPGGIGEPVTALVAPAIANALFTATGKRVRQLPIHHYIDKA
jgi:isoquinoline 1-oxidoreductase beta subunit